jgi:aspartyl-tRNA(Asn)/glutamyl-tRNA(Gln) amidotransferase subunit C
MTITASTIQHVAKLAKLSVAPEHLEATVSQMNQLLRNFEQLARIDVQHVEPLFHPGDLQLQLRNDVVTEVDQSSEFLAIAPETASGMYLVPKVIEG